MKRYIGDSVYVDMPGGAGIVMLTTENGPGEPSNTIIMEEQVVREFLEWLCKNGYREDMRYEVER